jgi:hypothetical protein
MTREIIAAVAPPPPPPAAAAAAAAAAVDVVRAVDETALISPTSQCQQSEMQSQMM